MGGGQDLGGVKFAHGIGDYCRVGYLKLTEVRLCCVLGLARPMVPDADRWRLASLSSPSIVFCVRGKRDNDWVKVDPFDGSDTHLIA